MGRWSIRDWLDDHQPFRKSYSVHPLPQTKSGRRLFAGGFCLRYPPIAGAPNSLGPMQRPSDTAKPDHHPSCHDALDGVFPLPSNDGYLDGQRAENGEGRLGDDDHILLAVGLTLVYKF